MGKINIDQLCRDFEACIGWPYVTPGTNDQRGIDCSGMFVRGYRLQGQRIYHGSNTIWRRHLGDKGRITSASDLRKGMAVFKWRPDGGRHQDGEGNFQHIGLVTGVNPLRIVHASTDGMRVKADTKIGKWRYWGYLLAGDYPHAAAPIPAPAIPDARQQAQTAVAATPMGQPTLRRGHRGEDVARLQGLLAAAGYPLTQDGIFGRQTREAVRQFQAARGLAVDGVVGRQTWTAMLGGR